MAGKKGVREYVTLECSECKNRNYRTSKQMKSRGTNKPIAKIELSKFCRKCRKHTIHKERKK